MRQFSNNDVLYVNQGQGIITDNPHYLLITTGMTECIGVLFRSKSTNVKALVHFDGDILYNQEIANQNVKAVKSNLQDLTKNEDFEIIAFGGRENAHNHNKLREAIYNNFNKNSIKFKYNSIEGYNPIQGNLTITSNGNFGTFPEVIRKEGVNISQYTTEYRREISTKEPQNHKVVLFNDKDVEELKPKSNEKSM